MAKNDITNIHLVRRTLVPLLIVALPIAATIAYILYSKQAHRPTGTVSQPLSEAASFGNESWEIFRGNAALIGRAEGSLPDALELAWKFETGDAVRSTPVVVENKVFVSSMDKHLYAIDLKTGNEIWKFSADDELEASPLYHNECIYVGSNSGTFYAINSEDGEPIWTFEVDGKITGSANIAEDPKTHNSIVVFGAYDNNLYGLEVKTGGLIFKHPAESYINGSIAVADNAAVFGSCDANIYQVPIADPNAAVTIDAGFYVATNPAIHEGVIYAGSYEGMFLAADAKTQKILWQFSESEDAFLSAPAVNGCRLP